MLFKKIILNIIIIKCYVLLQRSIVCTISSFLFFLFSFLYVNLSYIWEDSSSYFFYTLCLYFIYGALLLYLYLCLILCFETSLNSYTANMRIEAVNPCGDYSFPVRTFDPNYIETPLLLKILSNNLINLLGNRVSHCLSITSWFIRSRY